MVTVERRRRAPGRPRPASAVPALLALLLAAAGALSCRGRDAAPGDLRELYLERGRQQLLAGDWQRALVFLGEAYRGAEADAGLRFLVARAAAPLRGGDLAGRRSVTLETAPGGPRRHVPPEGGKRLWASADLNDDWTRLVAVDAGGEAAVFDPRDGRRIVGLAAAPPDLAAVRFSPDGEHVAGLHAGGRFSLWRQDTGELVLTRQPPPGRATAAGAGGRPAGRPAMAFFACGRRLIAATAAGAVRVWDTADGAALASFEIGSGGTFAFAPDGRRLVTVAGPRQADRVAMIWNLDTGKPIVSLDLPRRGAVRSLAYSPDGRRILTAGEPPEVRLFDATSGELEALMTGHTGAVCCAVFSPRGGLILTAGADRTARIWDAGRGLLLAALPLPAGEVIAAEYGPRAAGIATVHADGTVDLRPLALETEGPAEIRRLRKCFVPWRLVSGRLLPATPDPRGCRQIRPIPEDDPEDLAAATAPPPKPPPSSKPPPRPVALPATVSGRVVDFEGAPIVGAEIRLWSEGSAARTLEHDAAVLAVAFSPDGRQLVTACRDGSARIWGTAVWEPSGERMRHDAAVLSAAFSPDGRRLVTASADGKARIWAVQPSPGARPVGEPLWHDGAVRAAVFSPDGRWLATASTDGTARLWDAATGRSVGEPLRHDGAVLSVAFSPDGRRLATASESTARVWEVAAGPSVAASVRHRGVRSAAFSPDGRRLVTASWDGSVRLWWVAAGRPSGPPSGSVLDRRGPVAAFSPDGGWLATAGWDGTVRVWQLSEPIDRVVGQHQAPVYAAAWSPDGRWLATASEDGTARVWSAESRPDAESLRPLLAPVAITDGEGRVWLEIDRTRRPALLITRIGYRAPPVHPLPFARRSTAFLAELSDTSTPSRIRGLAAEQAAAPGSYRPPVGIAVSLSLRGADLVETLRSFARIFDLQLLFAPGIEGTVDAELPDVPWDQAFDEILKSHDLVYEVVPPLDPPGPERGSLPIPVFQPAEVFDQEVFVAPPTGSTPRPPPVLGFVLPRDGRIPAPAPQVLARFPAGEPIDMSLRDADLVETLRSFAMISGFHWTIDPDVAGTLSVELRGVSWTRVLAAILRLHDLRLEVSGNAWRIRRRGGGP